MKKTLLTAIATLFFASSWGQGLLNTLLIDDSDDTFNHVEDFAAVLDSLGITYTLYDAQGTGTVPTLNQLQGHNLVIWHCGSDSDSLSFWSRTDTANPALEAYLSSGGMLWAIGTDLLYDRYGTGASFGPGDFPWDFMALQSYDVQSYVDDGGLGVPVADPSAGSPIGNLPQLDWIFSTLWYVDGVTPINGGGVPVYEMGDANYVFSGKPCAVHFENGTSQVLSFFFNPSQISTFQKHKDMTLQVMSYFHSQILAAEEGLTGGAMQLFPNPANEALNVRITSETGTGGLLTVHSVTGQKVMERPLELVSGHQQLRLPLEELASGVYVVRVNGDGLHLQRTFVKR